MKKIFLLFLCFVSSITFSQEYHFDYFITEKHTDIKPQKREWINESFYDPFTNKSLSLRTQNDKIIGIIYEEENRKRHVFKVDQYKDKLTLTYKFSNQFPKKRKRKCKNKDVFKVEKIDSLLYDVILFKNSKLNKKKMSTRLKIEKNEFNKVYFSTENCRDEEVSEKIKKDLDPKFMYIVTSVQKNYHSSGHLFEDKIQKIQKTSLIIVIPQKLKYKKIDYSTDFEE
ncbi:hypothetical protein PGH12_05980 [Chryseobacterium wangxinyae]|uniref:hypothetical protein n=1 Tax=Chryseobacterium sp. CY350 TaxID=2997336 RepID=UPI002270B87F|nr:hypothetical protein [Chryseobacterium sp. CY350]MCY0976696.1 hypothetical protein [Chryseobacterium sp. CY350]WBZ96697.1 hypothetical protein PGH12_05980 [Chryseobacterium sp. CY350]